MKNYQKPELEYVVLTTAEEIADSTVTPGMGGGVVVNPFAPPSGGDSAAIGNWIID